MSVGEERKDEVTEEGEGYSLVFMNGYGRKEGNMR